MTEATTDGTGEAVTGAAAEAITEAPAAVQSPEWMATLPDDLKADATLSRYADISALAKAHIEAHKTAKSKFIVPAADAAVEAWDPVWNALGRPEDAAGYDIPLPAGQEKSALADAFRPVAHKLGLSAAQAKGIAEFQNGQVAADTDAYYAKGAAEIAALQTELGAEYGPKKEAAKQVFAKLFGNDDEAAKLADELDSKVGSGRLMKAMMLLADRAGEHVLIDDDISVEGLGDVADAEAKLTELQGDKAWREKLNGGDPIVKAQRDRLLKLAQSQALRRQQG